MKQLDCRNLACPLPVVQVKRALEGLSPDETLRVLLDDGAPRENVTRFAVNRGYQVSESAEVGGFALVISGASPEPAEETSAGAVPALAGGKGPKVILITSDRLGDGPEELGRLLMKNFIITLLDVAETPDLMLFLNTGVLLTTEGSEVLEALTTLGNRGVEVLSCGVCLDFFHRKEKLAAGQVTNMFTIAESLLKAGSVVRL